MKLKEHTRNQKRMYRIHKQDEKIHDLELMIGKLQQKNEQLKANYERLYNENCKLREEHNINDISLLDENQKLKDNWNKLKKYIKTEIPEDVFIDTEWFVSILDKMQELQGRDSNENN